MSLINSLGKVTLVDKKVKLQFKFVIQFMRRILLYSAIIFILTGCLSPITLNRAMIAYDEAVTKAESEQLLINIARAQQASSTHSFYEGSQYYSNV